MRDKVKTVSQLRFVFFCVPEKSKTYLAEARLTWQKQDLPGTKQDLNYSYTFYVYSVHY